MQTHIECYGEVDHEFPADWAIIELEGGAKYLGQVDRAELFEGHQDLVTIEPAFAYLIELAAGLVPTEADPSQANLSMQARRFAVPIDGLPGAREILVQRGSIKTVMYASFMHELAQRELVSIIANAEGLVKQMILASSRVKLVSASELPPPRH